MTLGQASTLMTRRIPLAGIVFAVLLSRPGHLSAQAPTATSTSTSTATPMPPASSTSTASATASSTTQSSSTTNPTAAETPTPAASTTDTATPSATPTRTSATATPTNTLSGPGPFPERALLINELAWAGTLASPYDEWIELHNPGGDPIELTGWKLVSGGSSPRISISLRGVISPFGYFLLERTDDTTVSNIAADQSYTGALPNSGDSLFLFDPSGKIIDSANQDGAGWPAGEAGTRASMERRGGADLPGNWSTFTGSGGSGLDAEGNAIPGTPRNRNSIFSATPTPTQTPKPAFETPTQTPTSFPAQALYINELAWAGTEASSSDEWIELFNPGLDAVDLQGWKLSDGGDIDIALTGTIAGKAYFLLERTDDETIADISANQIYTGTLRNSGETLRLFDPSGVLIDSANSGGGTWPGGSAETRASMERRSGEDRRRNWRTFSGYFGCGRDVKGIKISGTPRCPNSLNFPTPLPTWIPGRLSINEVLIRPHYDWNGDGEADTQDEFIEIHNLGPHAVDLDGWMLDDMDDGGSKPFFLPGVTIGVGERRAFFNAKTHIALNDGGDTVRLLAPDGHAVDEITYLKVRAYNLSFGRLPDGSKRLFYGLWPTPHEPNVLFVEPPPQPEIKYSSACPPGIERVMRLPRLARHPGLTGWMSRLGYVYCRWEILPQD